MKNRRSLASRLFSPVSLQGIRVANYIAASFVIVFGVIMALLLSKLEQILANVASTQSDPAAGFVLDALFTMKFMIPVTLTGIALFVLLGTVGQKRQINSEMVPLLAQIDWIKTGDYGKKRFMRKDDSLIPIMTALHELADRLAGGSGEQAGH